MDFIKKEDLDRYVVCSNCFRDQGLKLDAERIGASIEEECHNCGSYTGKKLTVINLDELAHRFFVWGSIQICEFGNYPTIQYNPYQETSIEMNNQIKEDVKLFEKYMKMGFFYYGPRAWMFGQIDPLLELQDKKTRAKIIKRILTEYPSVIMEINKTPLYRIRKAKDLCFVPKEFDSPPDEYLGTGRLDSQKLPILYASSDLDICVHEMRATVEDELYVGTLISRKKLKLLDLTVILSEESVTEFESLDLAVNMLFLAGKHAYEITREISIAADKAGFDGIIYPSYFSYIRNGVMPYQAGVYGISNRRIKEFQSFQEALMIRNIAIFGRPIEEGKIDVISINKLMLAKVEYQYIFGPVEPTINNINL